MVESPQRIWIEADDECPYFYEAHELHDVGQDVIEYVRSDLYAALEAQLAAFLNELSGNTGELIDRMAAAIRDWGSHYDDGPWETLPEDRKAGWRGDAERALAVVKEYLTDRRPSEQAVTEAGHTPKDGVPQDALAIIEKLRAENADLRLRLEALYESDNRAKEGWNAAEARLAEAVEALERIAAMSGTAGSEDGGEGEITVNGLRKPTRIQRGAAANEVARTFLQSLGKEG